MFNAGPSTLAGALVGEPTDAGDEGGVEWPGFNGVSAPVDIAAEGAPRSRVSALSRFLQGGGYFALGILFKSANSSKYCWNTPGSYALLMLAQMYCMTHRLGLTVILGILILGAALFAPLMAPAYEVAEDLMVSFNWMISL